MRGTTDLNFEKDNFATPMECFQKSLKGACIYLPWLPRSWQSLNKLWRVLEIF